MIQAIKKNNATIIVFEDVNEDENKLLKDFLQGINKQKKKEVDFEQISFVEVTDDDCPFL